MFVIEKFNGLNGCFMVFVLKKAKTARTTVFVDREANPPQSFGKGGNVADTEFGDFKWNIAEKSRAGFVRHWMRSGFEKVDGL